MKHFLIWYICSDKMMLKKLHTKENQKTYFLDGTNQHRIETKNTCQQINILYIHGYVSKRGVFFWFQKGFFERKKGHLILRQPPPHTQTHVYIYILIILYIKIHNITYIYIYTKLSSVRAWAEPWPPEFRPELRWLFSGNCWRGQRSHLLLFSAPRLGGLIFTCHPSFAGCCWAFCWDLCWKLL